MLSVPWLLFGVDKCLGNNWIQIEYSMDLLVKVIYVIAVIPFI